MSPPSVGAVRAICKTLAGELAARKEEAACLPSNERSISSPAAIPGKNSAKAIRLRRLWPPWNHAAGRPSTPNRSGRTAKTNVAKQPTANANDEPAAGFANSQPRRRGWFWCTVTLKKWWNSYVCFRQKRWRWLFGDATIKEIADSEQLVGSAFHRVRTLTMGSCPAVRATRGLCQRC